ncbi:hypothetical protein DN752_08255 [Echinicola strongylocentroti]|uniref:Uncharacterized protein n=1 Tax=Echinicola strongylocentroti TaxID=1795355 RepID=A0A2Z4IHT3_9BACT|nr:hypothetical protein [Echinicola strongylocentroti]AWW30116.1 hypothetical protein DN752_08255 [Echinicola strongylocentroti]
MIAFEVEVNKRKKVIGLNDIGVLSFSLIKLPESTNSIVKMYLGGYDVQNDLHFKWLDEDLMDGDEVSIKIHEGKYEASSPISVKPGEDDQEKLKRQIKYYYVLEKELKSKNLI